MFEKTQQFLEQNKEAVLASLIENPQAFFDVFFKHPAFSMNFEISGIQPLDGPSGKVFYPTFDVEQSAF